jgi:branched-chain amino acid transport system permease protein
MQVLAQVVLHGTLLGGLYALMGLGLSLVWGTLNIVNLAHGALIASGGYVSWTLFHYFGIDPLVSLPLNALVLFACGYAIQRGVLNLIVKGPMFNTLLITFGLQVIITYVLQIIYSADFRTINPGYAGAGFSLAGMTVPLVELIAFVLALALTGLTASVLRYTTLGRWIRASAQNLGAARLYGAKPRHVFALTYGIGAALAGIAGALYGMVAQLTPYIGATLTAKSFAIAVIGGLDTPATVILAGVLLGVAEALTALYIGPTWTEAMSFGILVGVLIARPTGLLGRAG